MIKGKEYHTYTETYAREKEPWYDDIPKHVAAFEASGKKIYQAEIGESYYKTLYESGSKHAFVINPLKEHKLRKK